MKGKKILIDTSIWIEYFRGSLENLGTLVDEYLSAETVFAPTIVMAELMQRAKSERTIGYRRVIQYDSPVGAAKEYLERCRLAFV